MNFTYNIEYQNKQARTVTVLYRHENPKALEVKAWALKGQVEGATTPEELDAIVWPA